MLIDLGKLLALLNIGMEYQCIVNELCICEQHKPVLDTQIKIKFI